MAVENNNYIITGAPSTGKSSVIEELRKMKFDCYDEVAREIIKENKKNNQNVFPWVNMKEFSDMVYSRMKLNLEHLNNTLCFLDRSVVDLIGYMDFAGETAPIYYAELAKTTHYAKKVFIMPLWDSIYTNDSERKESIDQAKKIDFSLRKAYTDLGFELVDVPLLPIQERARFILNTIGLEVEA